MSRAATSPELALFRGDKQWSRLRAAIYTPSTIYTGRVNFNFTAWDKLLEIPFDGGSGTLANVLPDMTLFIGSSAGAWDIGIARVRAIDSDTVFIGEISDIKILDNHYLTIVDDFGLWARPILISSAIPYMDGGVAYSDQHTNWNPFPKMGPNRVGKLTEADISFEFDFSGSFVPGSSISGYSTSSPTASGISGGSSSTPTVTFDAPGWHLVYLTLTAANGKSFFGVRYIYIWDDDNPPASALFNSPPRGDVDSGGWEFSLTLYSEAGLSAVRDHALVLLFTEDHYGSEELSIGPAEGAENILAEGWISKESIDLNPEAGSVSFTIHTSQYWFKLIPSWPDGVEFTTAPATAWTNIRNLTIDLGLAHFLMWRTTAPRVIDITLPGDSRYSKEVGSLTSDIWGQLQEMAWEQIYARPLVNSLNQLFIEIHPQLVPSGSRSWPTVMAFQKSDWIAPIELERVTLEELSILDFSGVAVNSSGKPSPFFSLAPGHSHSHYGQPSAQNRRLLSSQSQSNIQAGLYRSWRNNRFPGIPIRLSSNNRLIDIAPRQKCTISIASGDTPRGFSYSGGLIPASIEWDFDPGDGFLHPTVTFEAETFEGLATNGDIPGSSDISFPPISAFPPLPPLDILIPGTLEPTPGGPFVIIHDINQGLFYASLADNNPQWLAINAGLSSAQFQNVNTIFQTPSGALFVAYTQVVDFGNYLSRPFFVARAPEIGGTFVTLYDEPGIRPSLALGGFTPNWGLFAVAHNPLVSEKVAFVMGQINNDKKIWIGSGISYSAGAVVDTDSLLTGGLSYGQNEWLYTRLYHASRIASAGGSVIATAGPEIDALDIFAPFLGHVRASSTGRTYHGLAGGGGYVIGDDNLQTVDPISDSDFIGTGFACDPSGTLIMTRHDGKGKSSDGGASFQPLPSLPPGNWWWGYAGGAGVESRWVAAGGSSIRISRDFGTIWENAEGNLSQVIPIPSINMVYVVGY